ncbi:serine hydrolase [Leptobacterium flavescens]|uniref:Serine hydrolase n=1 Tax=Leptobacterium flavescens TaxID=472055 RepID=A0A6P0UJL3_9FLAO|nr:serine hydrolase [Leptobacterium flavescens]NER13495.1 serine hydrolase [Leptobacterium flavescens]
MINIVKLIIALLISSFIYAQQTPTNKALHKKIDRYLTEGVANGFSGAVLISRNGEIVLNKGYGLANRAEKRHNTPKTVFSTGSVTKQFTGTAILKLVEQNKLKLTDVISTFFDGLPEDKKDITIHQLLTHSAGLVDVIGDGDFDYIPTDEFFKTLFATKLLYQPGARHRYSNAGYSILARIIELVSGQDYESFLQQYLFEPAGMKQTGYLMPEWDNTTLANGYARSIIDLGTMVSRFQKAGKVSWVLKGNGGIQSTQEDMFKWYKALKSNTVLSEHSTKLLTTPYIQEQQGSDESFYAYGWAIFNSERNTKIVTHNGSNGIFFHEFMWLPEEDVVIIFSTNAYSREVEITWRLKKMLFDNSYQPKPIKKNSYFLVMDFVKKNKADQADALLSLIKQEYGNDFKNANVLNQVGYMLLENDPNSDWTLELFKLNVQLFPNNANLWDSLGDGYKNKNDKENAITSYKKALELDPTISASKKSLAELGITVKDTPQKEVVLSPELLKSYTGTYQLDSGHLIKIVEDKGKLYAEFAGRPGMLLTPRSEVKFAIGSRNAALLFNKNKDAKIESLTILESGEQMVAKRK